MNQTFNNLLQKKGVIPTVVGVVAFSAGIGIGYILGKRNGDVFVVPQEALDDVVYEDSEAPRVKLLYDPLDNRLQELLDEEAVIEEELYEEQEAVQETPKSIHPSSQLVEVPESRLILVTNDVPTDPYWDYEAELSTRKKDEPYVIHQEEFFADEMDFHQETLTYYAGDDIVADSDDAPIYNYAGLMGELKFGHGSNDPNVVYIRNEKIHMEWELLLHEGSFEHEVMGLEMEKEDDKELRHSVQKFRQE